MEDRIEMDQRLRRFRTDLNKPSELAIREAIKKVEELEANLKLTEVVVMLDRAFTKLADYFDSTITEEENIINAIHKLIESHTPILDDPKLFVSPKVRSILLEEIKKQFGKYVGNEEVVDVIRYKGFRVISSEDLANDEIFVK